MWIFSDNCEIYINPSALPLKEKDEGRMIKYLMT